jgi:hypothetical protein
MMKLIFAFFFAFFLLVGPAASAQLSLGTNFGVRSVSPASINDTSSVDALQIKSVTTFGIELIYTSQFPIGIKYDGDSVDKTANVSGTAAQRKISSSWLSLIGGYTFYGAEGFSMDGIQASVLGQFGLVHSSKLSVIDNVNNVSDVSGKSASSLGAYLEVTKTWETFILGAQLGYLQRKIKDFEVSSDTFIVDSNGSRVEVDLSGPITNLILGFRF